MRTLVRRVVRRTSAPPSRMPSGIRPRSRRSLRGSTSARSLRRPASCGSPRAWRGSEANRRRSPLQTTSVLHRRPTRPRPSSIRSSPRSSSERRRRVRSRPPPAPRRRRRSLQTGRHPSIHGSRLSMWATGRRLRLQALLRHHRLLLRRPLPRCHRPRWMLSMRRRRL